MIGSSKVFVCTNNGEIKEFGSGSSGSEIWTPVQNVDFTYTGDCEIIDDSDVAEPGYWRIKFRTSGIFKSTNDMSIDVFLVGGGGAGAGYNSAARFPGGGGGYTATYKSIKVLKNTEYQITVGDGANKNTTNGVETGGSSSAFGHTANGGCSGIAGIKGNSYAGRGGDGGSGGGGYTNVAMSAGTNGGSDGSDGTTMTKAGTELTNAINMGTGQGTTTREFGEPTGDLYAGGGGGGGGIQNNNSLYTVGEGGAGGGGNGGCAVYTTSSVMFAATSGTPNTGGGGGGSAYGGSNNANNAGLGGSGIVIIRNHRE